MSNYSIGEKSAVQINWEENSPINDQLREIVEPLTDDFNEGMADRLQSSSAATRQEMVDDASNIYKFRYGRVGMIPVAAFGNISTDTIDLERELTLPKTGLVAAVMARGYTKWADNQGKNGSFTYWSHPTAKIVQDTIRDLRGTEYPEENWWTAAREVQRALQNEPSFIIDTHLTNRMNNAALDYDQLNDATRATHRPYESYALGLTKKAVPDKSIQGTRDVIQLPIGEYGDEAANKLVRLTVALNDFIKTDSGIDAGVRARLDDDAKDLLAEHTARSRERFRDGVEDYAIHGVKNTLTEGILSIAQTLSFLTAEKVPGYDSHDKLVKAILEGDVIEQFTRLVKPGYIGPASLAGLYMPGALVEKNGKLALSKDAMEVLKDMRKTHIADVVAQWTLYRSSGGKTEKPAVLGLVCPAAAPKGAISTAKNVIKAFYQDDMLALPALPDQQ